MHFYGRLWLKETPAVCVPPGARLLLRDIPKDLQRQFDVQATEEVTFVQLSAEAYQYRDAVRFRNGREVLLQWLRCGQCVEVLSLCSEDSREEDTSGARRSIAEFLLSEAELTAVTAACQHLSGAPMLLVERIAHADDAAVCP